MEHPLHHASERLRPGLEVMIMDNCAVCVAINEQHVPSSSLAPPQVATATAAGDRRVATRESSTCFAKKKKKKKLLVKTFGLGGVSKEEIVESEESKTSSSSEEECDFRRLSKLPFGCGEAAGGGRVSGELEQIAGAAGADGLR